MLLLHIAKFVLLLAVLFSLQVRADLPKKARVAVYHIEGMLEQKREDLPYTKILNMLNNDIPVRLDFLYFHALRATEIFDKKDIDCLFPGSILSIDEGRNLIESTPINEAKAYFLSTDGVSTERILDKSKPQLKIGFRRGNTFGENIRRLNHQTLMPLNTGADVRTLMKMDRIDVFLGYFPDSLPLVDAIPEQPLLYNNDSFFYSQKDSFLCHNTETMRAVMALINDQIRSYENSGELSRIMQTLNPSN